jgi:hypothetical protein
MVNLADIVDRVCFHVTYARPLEFPAFTLTDAKETEVADELLIITRPDTRYALSVRNRLSGDSVTLPLGEIKGVAASISNIAFSKTTYTNTKADEFFKILYDVQRRSVSYSSGGKVIAKFEETLPCQICGVILPTRNITVDHQRPQAGGGFEAIAKTFRAFGLTLEGPKGQKGQMILAHLTKGQKLSAVQTQISGALSGGASVKLRYTLSALGAALYSIVRVADEIEALKTACLHGLLNLKPACNFCNSSRGQSLKFPDTEMLAL